MTDQRPSNSEQRLIKLEEEESEREIEVGILEIFDQDEDAQKITTVGQAVDYVSTHQ